MELSERQEQIIQIVKNNEPISGQHIAEKLALTKSTLRSDLAVLTMTGILEAKPKVGYYYSGLEAEPFTNQTLFETTVGEVMIPPVVVHQDLKIKDAITHLFMYDSGSLYVVDKETQELIGIISRKDLLRSAVIGNQGESPVAIIMTRMPNVYRTVRGTSAFEAAQLLQLHQVDSLPVMKDKNSLEVIGKISKTNLLEFFIDTLKEQS